MTENAPKLGRALALPVRLLLLLVALLLVSRGALARPPSCSGPAQCCPTEPAETLSVPATVQLGVLLVGLYGVDEKGGHLKRRFLLEQVLAVHSHSGKRQTRGLQGITIAFRDACH
jgi:hypothetical protein